MRRLCRIFLTGAAWLAAVLPAGALNADIANFKLDNGMEVVVIPDHRAPVVTHMVYYRTGSADEPGGVSGIAHFLEHLLFKGTTLHPTGEFDRIVAENGGEDNAFTSKDTTAYFQRVAKDRLGLMMALEADRMQNIVLTDKEVLPERDVILEERRERTDNDPASLLGEQVEAAMYMAHPYGKPVIGWRHEMEALSREDALAFYKKHYTPSNAILVVAGDVTAEEVKALAAQYYAPLENTFIAAPRQRSKEPEPIAARRVTLADPRVAAPMVQRSYLTVSNATATPGQAEAREILAEALGGGSTSILYKRLVVDKKLASYAGAWYSGDALDYGSFGVYAAPVPGGDLGRLEAELDAVLADVLAKGLTAADIARAKNKLESDTVYALDSQASMARLFGTALTTGSTVEDVLAWPANMLKVTAADIETAALQTLDIRRSVTGVLLPAPPAQN